MVLIKSFIFNKRSSIWGYGDGAGNTIEENFSAFSRSTYASCYRQGHVDSKTLLQQFPPVLNWGCRLTQVVLYNCRKMVVVAAVAVIRPHHSTTYVDAAYCYWPSSVVCWSVGHTSEPCKNGWIGLDAVWVEDSAGHREPHIRWDSRSPHGNGKF